jgi:hypothetical protein
MVAPSAPFCNRCRWRPPSYQDRADNGCRRRRDYLPRGSASRRLCVKPAGGAIPVPVLPYRPAPASAWARNADLRSAWFLKDRLWRGGARFCGHSADTAFGRTSGADLRVSAQPTVNAVLLVWWGR